MKLLNLKIVTRTLITILAMLFILTPKIHAQQMNPVLELIELEQPTVETVLNDSTIKPIAVIEETTQLEHTVKKGETLTKIAKKYNIKWERIFYKNKSIKNPDVLKAGITLQIPPNSEKLKKRKYTQFQAKSALEQARIGETGNSLNLYAPRNCTWYAKSRRPDLPNNLGDSINWVRNASAQNFKTGSKARVGAIGQQGMHVVYIEKIKGNKVHLSEMNYDYNGGFRYRWANASDFMYIY